jgi:hypothetical protein
MLRRTAVTTSPAKARKPLEDAQLLDLNIFGDGDHLRGGRSGPNRHIPTQNEKCFGYERIYDARAPKSRLRFDTPARPPQRRPYHEFPHAERGGDQRAWTKFTRFPHVFSKSTVSIGPLFNGLPRNVTPRSCRARKSFQISVEVRAVIGIPASYKAF